MKANNPGLAGVKLFVYVLFGLEVLGIGASFN
jgi:hypothetical protein